MDTEESGMTARPALLVLIPLPPEHQTQLAAIFDLSYAPDAAARAAAVASCGERVRVVLTNGVTGIREHELAAMASLELVCCLGAGYECLPMEALRARGITTANGTATNDNCVADHAMGLLIGIVRDIRNLDNQCRAGIWPEAEPEPPQVSGRKLGIFGLGTIGQQIAQRAAGFNMPVGYHNRRPREGVAHRYFASLHALADWCDILVCAAPGGPVTRHSIDEGVLEALGPRGYFVNISRGTVVDTAALARALRERRIAGAALDVYEGEPRRPEALIVLDNVLLTPHMAGSSPEATMAGVNRFIANATGHFCGRGVVSPI